MKPDLKLVENTGSQLEVEQQFNTPPQQTEMPFAVVDGEPVTELPRDLYIPPDALTVFLEAFEGPLDLLLYLIRRQNLDVLDIPIAEITRQYMKYIDVMQGLQLELAGEYLLMAAMLAEIKSRMLLPRPPAAEGQEEEDPRAELIRRLQEYERFKKAAEDLDQIPRLERDTLAASAELTERKVVKILPEVTLKEMLLAFRDVLQRADMFAHHQVQRERLSTRQRMSDILDTLRSSAFVDFVALFRAEEGRMGVTVTFIAILELMKEGLLEIVQAEAYAPIHVRPASRSRELSVVEGTPGEAADAENAAALAQPALPDEDEEYEEELELSDDAAEDAEAALTDDATLDSAVDANASSPDQPQGSADPALSADDTAHSESDTDSGVIALEEGHAEAAEPTADTPEPTSLQDDNVTAVNETETLAAEREATDDASVREERGGE